MERQKVLDKIAELSNQIHKETLRGGAELVLLSERAYDSIEDDIENSMLDNSLHVIQPGEWGDPDGIPDSPCDIRAIYFGGMVDIKQIGDNVNLSYGDDLDAAVKDQTKNVESGDPDMMDIPDIDLGYTDEPVEDVSEEYTFKS